MLTHTIVKHDVYVHVSLQGRIDGMTTPELDQLFIDLITEGTRRICVNLQAIQYISSVGLRVFLKTQKQLTRAAGKLLIQHPSEEVLQVFTLSGFDKLFEFIQGDCDAFFGENPSSTVSQKRVWNQIDIEEEQYDNVYGKLITYGSTAPLHTSAYTEADVNDVLPQQINFGCGLAALGKEFSSYAPYFGEALVIEHACLVYPALEHAAVDMMLGGTAAYHFLNGFGFSGKFNQVALLEPQVGFITINQLIAYVQETARSEWNGVVLMGECKGLWGMNLRKVPLQENNPQGSDIMAQDSFASWMNFSIEPSDFDTLLIGCGVVKKTDAAIPENLADILPRGGNAHIHGAVFNDVIMNKTLSSFSEEMRDIMREKECTKVQHLLSKTCFSSIMIGIIPLQTKGA